MSIFDAFFEYWGNLFDYFKMIVDTLVSFVTTTVQAIPWILQATNKVPLYLAVFPRHITVFFTTALGLVVLWQFLDKD